MRTPREDPTIAAAARTEQRAALPVPPRARLRSSVRLDELRRRLDELYLHYDHRFVDPDPLQLVRAQDADEDREVVGVIASALAYGNVLQGFDASDQRLRACRPDCCIRREQRWEWRHYRYVDAASGRDRQLSGVLCRGKQQ